MVKIEIAAGREHLHRQLEEACDRAKEGDFIAARFVEVCMEELWCKIPFDNPNGGQALVKGIKFPYTT